MVSKRSHNLISPFVKASTIDHFRRYAVHMSILLNTGRRELSDMTQNKEFIDKNRFEPYIDRLGLIRKSLTHITGSARFNFPALPGHFKVFRKSLTFTCFEGIIFLTDSPWGL